MEYLERRRDRVEERLEEVLGDVEPDELADEVLPYPHERLYSTETLKQTGARYEPLVGEGDAPESDGVAGSETA